MIEHTPIPWTDEEGDGWIRSLAVPMSESRIGQVHRNRVGNAAFIVRAVNTHAALLAAAEEYLAWTGGEGRSGDGGRLVDNLRAAIDKANAPAP